MKFVRVTAVACAAVLGAFACLTIRPASGQVPYPPQPNYPRFALGGRAENELAGHRPDREMEKLLTDEARLQQQAAALVEEYSRTEDEKDRAKIKSKLSDVLDKQFDAQQKRRDLEVERIEAQLKKLRALMKKRAEARQKIVDNRLDQLLREADGLGWTAPAGSPLPQNGDMRPLLALPNGHPALR
ncbi:MAG TPA: hypothetical protein VG013_16690 [Gemmataceae bacterium]|jgi:hypothetical protein|nr:hypothetical protein [Gemmataceae bacterium]